MKLCILVAYMFLIKKKLGGQSVHLWSRDITKHEIYKIGHISAIFKDRDFWFGPKNYINYAQNTALLLGSSSAFLVT